MKLHLIGGFLGSGKTTAIAAASRLLIENGVATAIVTNDQGKFLVDSHYIQSLGIPNAEVTDGCFCCHYDQLASKLDLLNREVNPSVVFAESVGSCTDLVATVLNPLLKYKRDLVEHLTFSTFADSRLLYEYLGGRPLPFQEDTNYIWEKQIEESEILIVNKVDLLSDVELQFIESNLKIRFPSKNLLFQNSYDNGSIGKWIKRMDYPHPGIHHSAINIDYDKYGSGEANLAWLDESIEFLSNDHSALSVAKEFISGLTQEISLKNIPIGHVKFLLYTNNRSYKFSYTASDGTLMPEPDLKAESDRVLLVVNARLQSQPDRLRARLMDFLKKLQLKYSIDIVENNISFFRPGFPKPTHRIG